MESLREAAHIFKGPLHRLQDFLQIRAQRGAFGSVRAGSTEHGSHGGEDLAKLVVEFARDIAQRRLLHGDELLRELATAFGNLGEAREKATVPTDEREAVQQNRQ